MVDFSDFDGMFGISPRQGSRERGYYDEALICPSGHVINSSSNGIRNFPKSSAINADYPL